MSENTMVSSREVPWMKLGKLVDGVMTAEDAAKLGGLDFTVSLRDIQFNGPKLADGSIDASPENWSHAPQRKYVVRDDNEYPFDVVSADYKILQYADAFTFLNDVHPDFLAAGTLKHGKQGFMVTKFPEFGNIDLFGGTDPHELFTVVRTSHDRSRAIEIAIMPLRGRCMNQLPLATFAKSVKQRFSIRHAGDVQSRMAAAKQMVTNIPAYATAYTELAERLAAMKVTVDAGQSLLMHVVRKSPKQEEIVGKILDVWQHDETVGFTDNAWGLVNGVSSYFEWERANGTPESRFLGAVQGQTYNAINKTVARVLTRAA
jgi:phage/plasmid-like protein (TIGR03299 family)